MVVAEPSLVRTPATAAVDVDKHASQHATLVVVLIRQFSRMSVRLQRWAWRKISMPMVKGGSIMIYACIFAVAVPSATIVIRFLSFFLVPS